MTDNGALQYKDYAGGIEYRSTPTKALALESFYHAEGRVFNTNVAAATTTEILRYEYAVKDHLGNARLTFTDKNGNGLVDQTNLGSTNETIQESHYSPFGLDLPGSWINDGGALDNLYKYNGKELNGDFGLGWMDYGARWYDGSVGRWWAVDPMAGEYVNISPYAYVANNPILAIDPDGQRILFVNGHYQDNWIGRNIVGSDKGGQAYWGVGFSAAAQRFFNDYSAISNSNFIDGSSSFGGDMSGGDRYDAGYAYAKANLAVLTADMVAGETFKMVTHSEGAAYGAGLSQYLIDQGYKVETVVHLSADEGDEFSTPSAPTTYQLGYDGDWVTGNKQINGVDKSGLVNSGLGFQYVHGSTRSARVFDEVSDLKTVNTQDNIGMVNGKAATWKTQILGSTPNGTDFTKINGVGIMKQDGTPKN